jgi:Flp pilus assembly protein TadD
MNTTAQPSPENPEELLQALITQMRSTPEGAAALQRLEPEQIDTDYAVAWEALDQGDMMRATDLFADLAQRVPDQHRIHFGFGLCLQHFGLARDAARHYGYAFVLDPSSAACAFRMGECLAHLGDRDAAREAYTTAVELCAIEGNAPEIRDFALQALDELR